MLLSSNKTYCHRSPTAVIVQKTAVNRYLRQAYAAMCWESPPFHQNGQGQMPALSRIVQIQGLHRACTAFQDGEAFADYENGDSAAAQGHLSLLKLRRKLAQRGEPFGRHPSYDLQRQMVGALECGDPKQVQNDLRFTHRAADWAAAHGHLDVLRCRSRRTMCLWLSEAFRSNCMSFK